MHKTDVCASSGSNRGTFEARSSTEQDCCEVSAVYFICFYSWCIYDIN